MQDYGTQKKVYQTYELTAIFHVTRVFLRCFRDPRIYRIREIGSLQVHNRYLTFSLEKKLM